jgi:hypothetical protein
MKTEDFGTDTAAFLEALHGKKRQKRGRNTRPGIPAAGRAERTGLTTLIAGPSLTWSTEYCVGRGFRLYVINDPSKDTGYHLDLTAACAAAREGNK